MGPKEVLARGEDNLRLPGKGADFKINSNEDRAGLVDVMAASGATIRVYRSVCSCGTYCECMCVHTRACSRRAITLTQLRNKHVSAPKSIPAKPTCNGRVRFPLPPWVQMWA